MKNKKYLEDLNISTENGLRIYGNVVREYNYIFHYILEQLDLKRSDLSLDNLIIKDHKKSIIEIIKGDKIKERVSEKTAIHNLKSLEEIIETIYKYQQLTKMI